MEEIWVKANIDTELRYEVSDFGNCRRFGIDGNMVNVKKHKIQGKKTAFNIMLKHRHSIAVLVDTLIMKSFTEGYYKNRKIIHIDNNILNCRLDNLEWKNGFKKDIDYDYLNKLDDSKLCSSDIMVKKYLLTGNILYIKKIIDEFKSLIFVVLQNYKSYRLYDDFLMDELFKLKKWLDKGCIKPDGKIRMLLIYHAKFYALTDFKKNPRPVSNEPLIEYNIFRNKDCVEEKKFLNIDGEISEMFSQLAS